ncbi:MAG: AAA family ATPase, partial [Myxococcales bacterium]|nr:AAA family ATPase [Myxococcales bacterium]
MTTDGSLEAEQAARRRRSSIIDFLLEVIRLRSPIQRDFAAKTEEHLWLADIPNEPGCWTRAWGEDEDRDDTTWLEVAQRPEPPRPALPAVLEPWVELPPGPPSLEILPRIRETILAPLPPDRDPDEPPPERTELRLANHPDLPVAFAEYVERKWKPWCELHKRWQAVHAAYTRLFAIHQAQQRLGEQYELVLAFGLLQWRRSDQDI